MMQKILIPFLVCVFLFAGLSAAFAERGVLTFGFPVTFFTNSISSRDAQAGFEIWVEDFSNRSQDHDRVVVEYINQLGEIESALNRGNIDFIALPSPIFLALREQYGLRPITVPSWDTGVGNVYHLLVNKSSGITGIEQLKGKDMHLMCDRVHDLVAELWLGRLLGERGLPEVGSFFGSVHVDGEATRIVTQLFFNKIDACVVTGNVLDVMKEMNPQIGRRLDSIAVSDVLVSSVTCVTQRVSEAKGLEIQKDMLGLQDLPRGEQIAMLFQLSRMVPFEERYLDTMRALLSAGLEKE